MLQLNLKLPAHEYLDHQDEQIPPALNRGVVFLSLVGLGWLAVWVAVHFVHTLFTGGVVVH